MGNDHGKQSSKKEPGGSSYRQDTAAERTHDQYHTALERGFKKYTAHRQPQEEKVFSRVDFTDRIFSLLPEIGELFFDYCKRTDGSNVKHEQGISCETYVSVFHDVMAATNSQLAQVYFELFTQKSSNKLTQEDALRLLSLCRRASFLDVSVNISFDDPDNESIIQSLCKSLMKTEDIVVDEDDFCAWLYRMCPRLVQDLHRYVTCSLTGQERNPCTLSHQQESSSGGASSKKTLAGSSSVLTDCSLAGCAGQSTVWLCANLLPSSYIPSTNVMASLNYESHFNTAVQSWCVLYSSSLHGLSVNRFQHHLMGYSGVTLLVISFDKYLYTVAIDQPWKESRTRWGGTNSSFFQILPEFRLCQSGEGLIHYNLQDRTVPKGIHIGKDSRTTFLKIDEEMINVNYYSVDYKIKAISVWGCDARDKLEAFQKQKQWERREVDKQQNRKLVIEDWRESADRQILELGGVQTDHAQRGDI